MRQSEAMLENNLIKELVSIGYEKIDVKNEEQLISNFKIQLEKHNKITLSKDEFKQVMNYLEKGTSVYKRANLLRDRVNITLDNGDKKHISFLNQEKWCQNFFQVTNQVEIEKDDLNRYDVTILINGLPLVQIELKRNGVEIMQGFNQIVRYNRQTMQKTLFGYVQIFVISNGVNTKYFANNKSLEKLGKQVFSWSDKENKLINNLSDFTNVFLEKCHLAKMITKYIVLNETMQGLMVLRPYQYYAVERIIEKVENTSSNGYIWHTTGSGKTLTSFKASQIIKSLPKVTKVLFVVDRNDLDNQTMKEFDSFEKGSVGGTNDTKELVKHLSDPKQKLIVTTIQKLNNAVSKSHNMKKIEYLKDEKVVFIFDECHRSQFGETHKKICDFFTNNQMFGFTGTPIFAENSNKNRTTKDLFYERLHTYTIQNAISDDNVLGFSIEYIGKYEKKDSATEIDIQVEDIDKKEILESEERIEKIVDYIIENHDRKTQTKNYNSIFAITNTKTLIKYYDIFKKKNHNLKIATIFSFEANEDIREKSHTQDLPVEYKREALRRIVEDYNEKYGENINLNIDGGYNNYFVNLSNNIKANKIDIVLVVNMFLTGFDHKKLNTLYVDKNLKYHGLIQAFSRTNRLESDAKSHGNVVCFRNLKVKTDEAIELFSDNNPCENVLMKTYEEYLKSFNLKAIELLNLVPKVQNVDELIDEQDQKTFVEIFRNLVMSKNKLEGFVDFKFSDLDIDEDLFEKYRGKYLDLYEKIKNRDKKEKVSVLDEIDFKLDLLTRDIVNVNYILMLLRKLNSKGKEFVKDKEFILGKMESMPNLRNIKDLIEEFIDNHLDGITTEDEFDEKFEEYIEKKRKEELGKILETEELIEEPVNEFIDYFEFTGKDDKDDILRSSFKNKVKFREKRVKTERVKAMVLDFVNKFNSLHIGL